MNKITESEMITLYDDMLDETKEQWINNYHGSVFEDVDPIAYRCGYNDFEDSMAQDGTVVENGEYDVKDEYVEDE